MWWQPETEHEALLREDVDRLDRWFHDSRRGEDSIAWGVGSVWDSLEKRLFPFVVLNAAKWLPRRRHWEFGAEWKGLSVFPLHAYPADFGPLPKTRLPLYATLSYRPLAASSAYQRARDLIADQVYLRDYVFCSHTGLRGTAGVRVKSLMGGEIGLLTAGHTFPDGGGTIVERRRWRRLGALSPMTAFGGISHHISPKPGIADWDVAIILAFGDKLPPTSRVTRCLRRLDRDITVFAHGARSGFVSDAIVIKAPLTSCGDELRTWKNCWLVTPGGVLRGGDSGSAVFTKEDGALLGVYVGSGTTARGRSAHHYVQDAWSIGQQVLRPWGWDYC